MALPVHEMEDEGDGATEAAGDAGDVAMGDGFTGEVITAAAGCDGCVGDMASGLRAR